MSWLNEFDLTAARADVANLLPDSCVIQAKTLVSDGAGGNTVTWAAVTSGTVACRLDPVASRTRILDNIATQESIVVVYQLTVPYAAPLAVDRRVIHDGNTYEIVQMDIDQSKRVARRAIVSEIRT